MAAQTQSRVRAPASHALSQWRVPFNRRVIIQISVAECATQLLGLPASLAVASESENCATCIGALDGTLGSCAGIDGCLSSYDDRPQHFLNPWEYDGVQSGKLKALVSAVEQYGGEIVTQEPLYLRAEFPARGGKHDVLEFLFQDDDNVVDLRGLSGGGLFPQSRMRALFEQLRATLRWEQVYILRNRKRFFGVIESPLDTFGDEAPIGDSLDRLIED